jgi:hypothetical protein
MAKKDNQAPTVVRVLTPCELGKNDDVVEVAADDLAGFIELGVVDPSPDAVAYVRSITHS